jgi:monothiol glutaredoxin
MRRFHAADYSGPPRRPTGRFGAKGAGMSDAKTKISELVGKNKVLLFMKGNKSFPQCGFSNQVVQILKKEGVEFETVNVLSDPEIRQGIKDFSNWPTIPQLYVNGKFVGGCDIILEMHGSGELDKELRAAGAKA